jgi:thiosulfate reductase cytochrome b subunit
VSAVTTKRDARATERLVLIDSGGRRWVAEYQHPAAVRIAHWVIALALPILSLSGLEILRAFPGFGDKLSPDGLMVVPRWATLGGWLGGALQWHLTFMWLFLGAGAIYVVYQVMSGNWRQVIVSRMDLRGAFPMARHYLRRTPPPPYEGAYNPLQKLAYTSVLFFGALAAVSGVALYKPVQLPWLVASLGGFRMARVWHLVALCGFLAFIPGHLVMVALHGWNNFRSMVTGFKLEGARKP